ncbi:cadherin domain-containing protein, partial [Okeania sp. SIO1I7]|uniref:cadherin domain-containing protein n=1 Tax=Okeania sp. SIO1I7 TaxID=2607772 RepID=UPI0013FBBE15
MANTVPSAQDQYMLELINRGRANPQAEADRYLDGRNGRDGDLNQGVRSQDTISTDAKQPLAFNLNLNTAAEGHAQWLLDENKFQHSGEGGTNSRQRMQAAGYTFTNPSGNGENLAWFGTTGFVDFTGLVRKNYENLFIDKDYRNRGHRVSLMNPDFQEIGISSLQGPFTSGGRTFNAVMSAQNFAYSGASGPFITGVVYTDGVTDDDFYTVGEGIGGITVTAVDTANGANTFTTTTWDSGGYSLDVEENVTYDVTFSGDLDGDGQVDDTATYQVTVGSENVKQDVVSDNLPPSTPTNSAPTAVEIDNDTIAENSVNNTVVGNLTTSDPDAGDTHTYQLLDDANGRFALDGDQIVVADGSGLDFESIANHNITVRTTDDGGESFEQQLTINVTDVDETPPNNPPTAVEID